MKILITGATGLVGAETVRQAIADTEIEEIIVLVRSQPAITHPKITVILHQDFLQYTTVITHLKRVDAVLWCLGISQTQVSKKQYEVITHDYAVACAVACCKANPNIHFVFVSGDGADRTGRSSTLFKRVKGRAENSLLQCGLQHISIARPDAVNPRHKNPKAPLAYRLVYPLFPLIEKCTPHKIIWSDVLARALLTIAKNKVFGNTYENVELRKIGK